MKLLFFDKKLTKEDVEEINQMDGAIIDFKSTSDQDASIIALIDRKHVIKVCPEELIKYNGSMDKPYMMYSIDAFCELLQFFETIEKNFDESWSDLEKAVYYYTELQKIPESTKNEFESLYDLSGALTKKFNSQGFAALFFEVMSRVGIPCKYVFNDQFEAWNEIKIEDSFYPVDLKLDSEEFMKRSAELNGDTKPCIGNFACNGEFYKDKYHIPYKSEEVLSKEELETSRILDKESVVAALDSGNEKVKNKTTLQYKENKEEQESERIKLHETIERKDIKLKSKEIAQNFEKGEILADSYDGKNNIVINITDEANSELIDDITEIGKFYPELLENIEIKNETDQHISFQNVIDKIYEAQKDSKHYGTTSNTIKIESKYAEDFDLDFSKAPQINVDKRIQAEGEIPEQGIEFVNLDENNPMSLPDFKHKLPKSITKLGFKNIDLNGVSVSDITDFSSKIRTITISGFGTRNINSISGIENAHEIEIDGVSNNEFDSFLSKVYPNCTGLDELTIVNQKLSGRSILREIKNNPNVSLLGIYSSKMDNIDGIEEIFSRFNQFNFVDNDLGVDDFARFEKLKRSRPYIQYSFKGNSKILDKIDMLPSLSDDSHKLIATYFLETGVLGNRYLNKKECLNTLFHDSYECIPYYAKDAKLVREQLGLKNNPMMVKDNSEIDITNFNAKEMEKGVMLLTIPQIEYVLKSGKNIPQEIRIKIEDVTQLDNNQIDELNNQLKAKGMNLTGVQIFDKDNTNNYNMNDSYSVSDYKNIRTMLERLTSGIDIKETDIDKFITIYMRIAETIPYDEKAIRYANMKYSGTEYMAEHDKTSKNLYDCLINGTCVCSGYADVLRNALKMVGVEAISNSGQVRIDGGGHAWNQVKIDNKWYYVDSCWDADPKHPKNRNYQWALRGKNEFINNDHNVTWTKKIKNIENDRYPEKDLNAAIARNEHRSFNFMIPDINIEPDPTLDIKIDDARVKQEYERRKNDMLAKYYGDKEYRREYAERSQRFRSHQIAIPSGSGSYNTVEVYPEREEDEKFLLLDGYNTALERSSKYENGDTSVYSGYTDPNAEYQKDKEYVTTRNYTFNQHENTSHDLATLGKFGETVPYIPRRQGFVGNVTRIIGNSGIFVRNLAAPVYRLAGRYIGQPIHRLITRNSDASPYRNNIYHRMVARRDYFQSVAEQRDEDETNQLLAAATDPSTVRPVSHPIRNAISCRVNAIFNVREGNKAVLSAGLADIRENIMAQENQRVLIDSTQSYINQLNTQIIRLQSQINKFPKSRNINEAKAELQRKKVLVSDAIKKLDKEKNADKIYSTQTDAIDARQHSIASKEVNTLRVTAIKGFAKGAAVKYIGPKIKDWLLERTQVLESTRANVAPPTTTKEWIPTTYKTEVEDVYGNIVDKSASLKDMMKLNKGNKVTGFYSVYGGENRGALYELTGDEKITAIFQSVGKGGKGLSDTVGLKAPTLTDGTFASDLLNNGILSQDISLEKLVSTLSSNDIDLNSVQDLYVSVSDRYWVKLADLLPKVTKNTKVDQIIKTVVDQPGHFITKTSAVNTAKTVTKLVNNSKVEKGANMAGKILKGIVAVDSFMDLNENLRRTDTDVKGKKKRKYDYTDDETDTLPTSKEEYDQER